MIIMIDERSNVISYREYQPSLLVLIAIAYQTRFSFTIEYHFSLCDKIEQRNGWYSLNQIIWNDANQIVFWQWM